MKRICCILPLLLALSCSSTDPVPVSPPRYLFQIDYQSGFQGDSVIVSIDGKVVNSGRFTSDSLGFAASDVLSLLASSHTLHVSAISNRVKGTYDTTFVQPSTRLYCGIAYSSNATWKVRMSLQPFSYFPTD
ncbi:MAG TPA: hypothetical protein VMM37_05940 [Bacteroidota bacterium]|nr:hypothetical protein [Bacteroidota bacterium]